MALQAYIDDSGNNAEFPVTVLAGFVARVEAWEAVSKKWTNALSADGLKYFKMKECHARRGQFAGWDEARRDRKLLELGQLIKESVSASTFAIVRRDEFVEFTARHGSPKSMRSPYFLLFYGVISAVLRSMEASKIEDTIAFIFDEQFKISEIVQSRYTEMTKIMAPEIFCLYGRAPSP